MEEVDDKELNVEPVPQPLVNKISAEMTKAAKLIHEWQVKNTEADLKILCASDLTKDK